MLGPCWHIFRSWASFFRSWLVLERFLHFFGSCWSFFSSFGPPRPRFWVVRGNPRGLQGRLSLSIFARSGMPRYALPSRVRHRSTNKSQNKKTRRFRFRPAFGCSCSPARLPRFFPSLATSRFTRCPKVSAPSYLINTYSKSSSSSSSSRSTSSSSSSSIYVNFNLISTLLDVI